MKQLFRANAFLKACQWQVGWVSLILMPNGLSSFIQRFLTLCVVGFAVPALMAQTAAPVPLSNGAADSALTVEAMWRITTGDDALRSGIPSMAERFYRQVLAEETLDSQLRRDLTLNLATALISQRKIQEAGVLLDEMAIEEGNARAGLRQALLAYYRGDLPALKRELGSIDEAQLPAEDLPWYYLLKGLLERSVGTISGAEKFFKRALETAVSASQRADFETEIFRSQIVAGQTDEETVKVLAKKVEETRGSRVGFGFARQYAIVLDLVGRKTDAIGVLQEQLGLLTEDEQQEETEMLLLIALIAGENSERGQLALGDILREPTDGESTAIALNLLSRSNLAETNPQAFQQLLDDLLEEGTHPLSDELLLLRARFLLKPKDGQTEAVAREAEAFAANDAETLIERFPGSPLRVDAIRLLAYQAWSAQPPRYRAAADYLNQIRESLPAGRERRYYGRLVADSYFLNRDYRSAAGVYEALLNEQPEPAEKSDLLLQLAETLSQEGQYAKAGEVLDRATLATAGDAQRRWPAEWRLASAMASAGQVELAMARVQSLLNSTQGETLPPGLRLRLMWLEARLASDLQNFEAVSPLTEKIIAEVVATPNSEVPVADRELIAANALFLRGRALMRLGEDKEAFIAFNSLREKFPQSNPAVLSFLEEARYYVVQGDYNGAQVSYRKIADQYPESEQSAIALFEGAMAAEALGQPRNLEEASRYLGELAAEQPEHELVFQARLKQGDLARKLGEFSLAQQTYEDIIRRFEGERADIYLVELYRANTLIAQAGSDTQRLLAAAAELEALFDRPDTPLEFRAETGFLLAHTLEMTGNAQEAQVALWRVVSQCAPEGVVNANLSPAGRVWLAKGLLHLADMLQAAGKPFEAGNALRLIINNRLPGSNLAKSRLAGATAAGE